MNKITRDQVILIKYNNLNKGEWFCLYKTHDYLVKKIKICIPQLHNQDYTKLNLYVI